LHSSLSQFTAKVIFPCYNYDDLLGIVDQFLSILTNDNYCHYVDISVIKHFAKVVANDKGDIRKMFQLTMESIRYFLKNQIIMDIKEANRISNVTSIKPDLIKKLPSICKFALTAAYNFVAMSKQNILNVDIVSIFYNIIGSK